MTQVTRKQISQALYQIDGVCTPDRQEYVLPEVIPERHGAVSFNWRGSQYSLFCSDKQCTVSRFIPNPETTAGEEILSALLGLATLGMAGCSSEPEGETDVLATYQADAGTGDVFQGQQDASLVQDIDATNITDTTSPASEYPKCYDYDQGNTPHFGGFGAIETEEGVFTQIFDKCRGDLLEEVICNGNELSIITEPCGDDEVCFDPGDGAYCKSVK